ncbi:MAG: hypothetical protein CK425_06140 [Parachlamydia sp.]|nr:MAG: hypothetical protein CK425_06140 [Parachlamydia sp.]
MTIILAKIFGLYFLGLGIVFLLNPKRIGNVYQLIHENEAFIYLSGILALLVGAFVVSVHNVWVMAWPVTITILGWVSLVKGVGLMGWSNFSQSFSFMLQKSNSFYRIIGLLLFLVGLFFSYQGWK